MDFRGEQKKVHNPVGLDDYGYGGNPHETFGAFGASEEPETPETPKKAPSGGLAGGISGIASGLSGKIPTPAGGRDYLENLFSTINYDTLVSKTFYFFFFAAFGSLFPLIAVYFKQLGMNPAQTGILIGFRPFVEFVSGPFWSNIADRWNKWKQILLFSLFCWVAFTLALAFVSPHANSCLVHNGTDVVIVPPKMAKHRPKRDLETQLPIDSNLSLEPLAQRSSRGAGDSIGRDGVSPGESKKKTGNKNQNDKSESLKTTQEYQMTTELSKLANIVSTTPFYHAEGWTMRFLPHPSIDAYGKSPLPLDHKDIANLGAVDAHGLVSPPLSAVVYRSVEIQKIFLILLVLMIIGEFLSAPAIELADAATLGYINNDMERYGRQRLFGSLGWGISMFFVGIALDHSNIFPNHPCGNEQLVDRNYTVCFAVFSVLMCCAFIAATQFKFKEGVEGDGGIQLNDIKEKVIDKVQARIIKIRKSDRHSIMSSDDETPDYGYDQYKTGSGLPSSRDTTPAGGMSATNDPDRKLQISLQDENGQVNQPGNMLSDAKASSENSAKPSPYVPRGRPGQSGRLPQWVPVLKLFGTIQHGSVLFILWFMGFGVGLVFAFLFWHLQDLHGTPTLFGFASVINHVSEVLAYFFSKKLISKLGHVKVLYIGMLGNVARYLYISWLRNPWWVLPFEFLQGLTHAAVWAAGCSYLTQVIPVQMRPTGQGILMAVHHGLGRAMGTIIGGCLVHAFGTEFTFRGYGIATVIILAAYIALNYLYISKYVTSDAETEASHAVLEETSHLAPYGVPMSLSRSRSNIDDDSKGNGQQQYGAAGPGGGNFLNPGNQGQSGSQGDGSGGDAGLYQGGGYGDKNPYHHGYSYKMDDILQENRVNLDKVKVTERKVGDRATIQQEFKAYDEATTMSHVPAKPPRDALVIGSVPKPVTEICMQQPANQYAYDQRDNWY